MAGRQAVTFVIKGTKRNDPLPRSLRRKLKLKDRKDLLYKILVKAGTPMRDMMRSGSPVRTGALQKSFNIRRAKKRVKFTEVAAFVGGINGTRTEGGMKKRMVGWRAHWAELGTVNHAGAYFLQPAIRKGIPVAQRIIRAELARLLRNLR